MRAHGCAFDLDGTGRQAGETRFAAATWPDGADDGAVGKDTAYARGTVETGIGEQLVDDECSGLIRSKLLSNGRSSAQDARTHDGNAKQHRRLHIQREGEVSKIS